MRSIYSSALEWTLGKHGPAYLFKLGFQWLGTPASLFFHTSPPPPILATILLTYRCNASCSMCSFRHRIRRNSEEWNTVAFSALIKGLAKMGVRAVGFTGGEPLLRKDIFSLIRKSIESGLITHLNTNGLVSDKEVYRQLVETGLHSVNISIDYPDESDNDDARGVSGITSAAWEMVDRLVSERFKHGNPKTPKIVIVASVGPDNVAEIPLLAEMADKHGADSMGVIPRHYRIEPGFSPLPHPDKTALEVWETVTLPALDKYIKSGFIDNSKGYLNLFKYYFMGKTLPFLCLAGFNSLTIDCYGDLFRCFPFAGEGINITTLASPPKTGEEAHLLLKKIWNSKEYGEERRIASKCRGCFWNCQTELTLLHHPLKTFF